MGFLVAYFLLYLGSMIRVNNYPRGNTGYRSLILELHHAEALAKP